MANKLGYTVTADVSQAIKDFGALAQKVEAVNKSVKKSLNAAFGKDAVKLSDNLLSKMKYVAAGLVAVSVAAVKMNADFEMTKRSITVLTGSAIEAKKHLEALERFAMSTPFEFTDLVDASKRLQAYGFQAQSVIPILNAVGNASMAVGLGKEGIDRVTLAIGQIAAKGKLSAEEMRQLAETGIPAWKMIADHMGISVAELMDKTKKGAVSANVALTGLFEGMQNKFGGMMEKVAQEIPQQLSNMKDAVASIMRSLGAEITDALDLKTKMSGVTTWLTAFAAEIKTSGVKEAMEELVPDSVKNGLVVVAVVVSSLLLPALVKLAMAAIAVGGAFTPIIATIAAGAYLIYDNWNEIKTFFEDLVGTIKFFLKSLWIASQNVFDGLNSGIATLIGKIPGLNKLADAYRDLCNVGPSPNQSFEDLWNARKEQTINRLDSPGNYSKKPTSFEDALARAKKMKDELMKSLTTDTKNINWSKILSGSLGSGSTVGGSGKTKKSATAKDDWNERVQLWAANADRVMKKAEGAKQAVKELNEMMSRADSEYNSGQDWEYQNGFMSRADYLEQLRQRFAADSEAASGGGILDMSNVFNWSPKMKEDFEKISNVLSSELNPQLDLLKERFSNNTITTGEYRVQLETLLDKYKEYPLLVQQVQEALNGLSVTQNSYAQSMSAAIADATENVNNLAATTSTGLADAFSRAIAYGDDLGDSLKKLGQDIIYTVTKMLLLQQITNMFSGLFGGSSGGGSSTFGSWVPLSAVNAKGGVFSGAGISAYSGSIVSAPTIFPFASGAGLMGEAGPEAILPLTRTSDGKLGVKSDGGSTGGYSPTINVTVNSSGSGDMSQEQAQALGKQINTAIEVKIAESLSRYQRSGVFKNAFAR